MIFLNVILPGGNTEQKNGFGAIYEGLIPKLYDQGKQPYWKMKMGKLVILLCFIPFSARSIFGLCRQSYRTPPSSAPISALSVAFLDGWSTRLN